jgi:hypothetical protein
VDAQGRNIFHAHLLPPPLHPQRIVSRDKKNEKKKKTRIVLVAFHKLLLLLLRI